MARLALALACLAVPATSNAAPQLKVKGNHLVDTRGGGQTFVPRGVNWPSFEYACSDGYGYSNAASASNVGPNAAGAAVIASWHINTVRIPLNQDCWLGEDGLPRFGKASGYRAAVKRWVRTLHEADLAVVLDLHWSGPAGVVSDGQRALPDDRSDDFWTSVARAFKRDHSVIFDVFNEPYSRYDANGTLVFDLTWECWRSGGCAVPRTGDRQALDGGTFTAIGLWTLVDTIRATGAKQPILLGGVDYASDLRQWLANRPEDKQVIASFHNYGGHACHVPSCWDEVIAPIAAETPVVTGEFGETDCATSPESFMTWADQHGVGYLMWAWWVLPDSACSTLSVLADVRGTARAPNGTALKAHLAALAPRISLGGSATQALDKAVEVSVRCSKACVASASGRLSAAGRTFRLKPTFRALRAGQKRTLGVKLSRKARRAATTALIQHRAVSARLTIAGAPGSRKTISVKLRSL
ncbi:MAG: endoglucanase [Thermoleophilaceae bacterium]|nr:endoglucanase [Thermoleophilaceae bacterium]